MQMRVMQIKRVCLTSFGTDGKRVLFCFTQSIDALSLTGLCYSVNPPSQAQKGISKTGIHGFDFQNSFKKTIHLEFPVPTKSNSFHKHLSRVSSYGPLKTIWGKVTMGMAL